ncbi:isoleucine--tRNA cytoplasmic isoform B [Chlorella sorokiniana]|uniref:isoleucine--tRNA ligase n=1 Tax=Chlorella sorokiniana TaxID=3076 RepID=A0A2P6TWK8_CHLSO|nr:isoleucine--tRNA cytoplasmic isoform B [Chlorella sorokiniana]|eukprot:PRW58449.1 isoleucine--tRNA cytoplasmic isoform B [Chlorella sorokiniana]
MAAQQTSGLQQVKESKDYHFPAEEEEILKFWQDIDAFKEQLRRTEGKPEYSFYDGPPFATGLPHYGHLLAGTLKDIVTRYASGTGHHVTRRFGWDCHGLPVEYEIDKKLNIKSRQEVLAMGIDKYNEECRSIVMRYSKEWEAIVHRLGRWIDFENDYKTLDPTFMESVWWVFKQLFDKGLVYRGFKVMPYSTGCSTALSNFEAGQNYKDVSDPAVIVSFPLDGDEDGAHLVAWTTTPWTLPSNLALCVNAEFDYVKARDPATGRVYVVMESRLGEIPGAIPKAKKGKKGGDEAAPKGFEVIAKFKGAELKGRTYEPLFPYYGHLKEQGAFKVVTDAYVSADSGVGIVHQAPAFGEDDYRVCLANGVIAKGEGIPCPLDDAGCFTDPVTDFKGQYCKDADKEIIKRIKEAGRLVDNGAIMHSYPFCWRSDTPLIYKAVPSWFVRVEEIKPQLLANNEKTYWVPSYVKEKRFHNWLENARDWAISRSRFWGTPIPIWVSEDFEEVVVVGSIAELEEATGAKVTDLHRHFIDHLTIPSRQGKGQLRRIEEVFDCWFESGSMPYAQQHYPFENKEQFEGGFPADFVAEGLDQTRGWFYTLMVLSTALFDKPAFKNLVCNGLVLAADGKKMSKRLKNYPDPLEVVNKYGADALRLYLINSPVVRAETLKFKEEGVFAVVKDVFLPWYNAYRFMAQNAVRWEAETGRPFEPLSVDVGAATNVLDRWICAASRSLTAFVREEMEAYRLYTVVPYLVRFIDSLTNIYVRYNRKRLKGRNGPEDTAMALAALFDVLLTVCKVMAPFTPFFTEQMYQNLRRALPAGAPESVHFCDIPEAEAAQAGDERVQTSVERMQRVIELARTIRERHNVSVKRPVREVVVVHPDQGFLDDLTGELREYVAEEVNVRALTPCADPLKYCSVRAEPEWGVLGKRLGKAMASVAKAVKALPMEDILAYEGGATVTVEGQELGAGDLKILRDFQPPAGTKPEEVDAAGDGEVLVVMDLRPDEELLAAGLAREVVNRVQRLRKKAGLQATDAVSVYIDLKPAAEGSAALDLTAVLTSQEGYVRESLGVPILPASQRPAEEEELAQEDHELGGEDGRAEFTLLLARPAGSGGSSGGAAALAQQLQQQAL